jgi:hypothetical protein
VHVQSTNAPAALLVRRSLVEQSHDFGVAIHGGQATVEASVVRGTLPNAQGLGGRGLNAQPLGSIAGSLLLRQSLVEQNHEVGVFVAGAELTVEASVVRDTQPETPGTAGVGVNAQAHPDGAASTLLLLTSLVERNHAVGVFVTGSNATVEASAVRNTEPDDMGLGGLGIGAQADEITGAASTLTLKSSLVEQSRSTGVLVEGSSATIEACAVRDTQPDTFGHFGRGVNVEPTVMTATPATLALHASLVENSHEVGVYIAGSEALVEASVVRATELGVLGRYSRGVNAQASMPTTAPSNLVLKSSLIEQNHECGVIITNSTATIESCAIRDTASNADGEYGDGLAVVAAAIPASASVTNTRISTSARAGLLAHSAHVALSESALTCHAFDLDSESSDLGPATLEDLGGNLCGCPEATARCAARSANLAPPPSVEPTTTP